MPRRKQLAPKRLKGTPKKGRRGESDGTQDTDGDPDERTDDEKDRESPEMLESPTASWSVKFTPYGSTTEKVICTTVTTGSSATSKVYSKGIWYPDDSARFVDHGGNMAAGDSSQSEDEQEKRPRKAVAGEKEAREKAKGSSSSKVNNMPVCSQRELENQERHLQHSASSFIRDKIKHFFLDKLKSSGKLMKEDESKKQKLSAEDGHSEMVQRGASTSNHQSRNNYTHTVLWMPPNMDKTKKSPSRKSCSPGKLSGENRTQVNNHHRFSNISNHKERLAPSSIEERLAPSSIEERLAPTSFEERLAPSSVEERLAPSSSSRSNSSSEEHSERRENSRSSTGHSLLPEMTNKSKSCENEESHHHDDASSYHRSLSPSEYYHSHPAGMAYYPTPFMGYGLYPSYPNFVYPYNYGYVMAVPGGLFIPMGHSSYSPSSGTGMPSSHAHHKDIPLDLSSCSTTKKEEAEELAAKVIKKEEMPPPLSSSSSSSVKHSEEKAESSCPKKRGEKTIVLWKKVPRHAMMMDMAQLSVLEKVHVLYTTESTFLCFICSDCHSLFNSLDLLALHAVGTAHSSRNDIDVKAMGLKGFEVIPMDKIAKKQKHVDKKPDFSFESPLQSTVSLHRRRLPGSKDFVIKNRDVYKCSVCPDTFPNFLRYTMHMNETGHRRKSVRYSDVYKAQKQVKKILKCMNCEKSFMTLEELTMHMIKTKHYSDIAGGFANQTELDEDTDFDPPDHLGHPEDELPFDGTEQPSVMEPRISSAKSSHMESAIDGTSSDSESLHNLRASPLEQWQNNSGLESEKEKIENRDDTLEESSKAMNDVLEETFSQEEFTAAGHHSHTGVYAGPSHSSLPSSQSVKRDLRYLENEGTIDDKLCKRIKVEAESAAEEEDDDNLTFGGYESENEYEEEEEDEMDSLDPEYSLRLFQPAHTSDRDVGKGCSFPTTEMRRKKYRTRIYKHSLLYQSRQNGSETKPDVSAFDGLYNWAKSLGLLSSPTVTLSSKAAQAPKAVVKCDGKYVDPDNFDVTLPYGGKVHPDVNPLSKLSSMVETTQIKQPQNKSFESNFIMDRAYFNFEKAQGHSPQTSSLAINLSSPYEDGDSHTNFDEEWESVHQEDELSDSSQKREVDNKEKLIENSDHTLSFPGVEKRDWFIDGTISKDVVLERLILKAYNRPSKSVYSNDNEKICSCSPEPEIDMMARDSETRPSKTSKDSCEDRMFASAGKANDSKDRRRASCKKCSHVISAATNKDISHKDTHKNTIGNVTTKRVKMETDSQRNNPEESVSNDNVLEQRRGQSTANLLTRAGVGRDHLQGLIYGHRDAVREVKFTWADAIDTLISRSFGSEDDPPEQPSKERVQTLNAEEDKKRLCVLSKVEQSQEGEKDNSKEHRVSRKHRESDAMEVHEMDEQHLKGDLKNSESKTRCLEESLGNVQEGKDNTQKMDEESDEVTETARMEREGLVDSPLNDGLNKSTLEICKADRKDLISKDARSPKNEDEGDRKDNDDISKDSWRTMFNKGKSVLPSSCYIATTHGKSNASIINSQNESCFSADRKRIVTGQKGELVNMLVLRALSRSPSLCTEGSVNNTNNCLSKRSNSDNESLHFSPNAAAVEELPQKSSPCKREKRIVDGKVKGFSRDSPSEEREDGCLPVSSHGNTEMIRNGREMIACGEAGPTIEESPDGAGRPSSNSRKKRFHEGTNNSEERSSKYFSSSKEGQLSPAAKFSDRMATLASHKQMGYFNCGSPPPLIPSVDASTKAIRKLEELTRKPAVTNVKEMILSKIQEEVERLIGPGCDDRIACPQHQSGLPYIFPRIENNNDVDSSKKSLKSLEELSKCAPLPPFKRMQNDVRLRGSEGSFIGRSDPSVKYLLPSTTPEATVSAIQSLEKLSTHHPVLRRNQTPQPATTSPLRPTSNSADKIQYLPPSFGGEASNANSIQSLERFSSQHTFFGYCLNKPHSKSIQSNCNMNLSEKDNPHGLVSRIESPLVVSLPKMEPLSPVESRPDETHMIRANVKMEDQESESDLDDVNNKEWNRHHDSDKKSQSPLASSSSEDPLMALGNLVRKKQGMEVSPSPSKVAWELVNKDMKPPLYILPPDDVNIQVDKNPLQEMNKMLKFP